MDGAFWIQFAFLILFAATLVYIWFDRYYWKADYKEAKEAEISELKARMESLKEKHSIMLEKKGLELGKKDLELEKKNQEIEYLKRLYSPKLADEIIRIKEQLEKSLDELARVREEVERYKNNPGELQRDYRQKERARIKFVDQIRHSLDSVSYEFSKKIIDPIRDINNILDRFAELYNEFHLVQSIPEEKVQEFREFDETLRKSIKNIIQDVNSIDLPNQAFIERLNEILNDILRVSNESRSTHQLEEYFSDISTSLLFATDKSYSIVADFVDQADTVLRLLKQSDETGEEEPHGDSDSE